MPFGSLGLKDFYYIIWLLYILDLQVILEMRRGNFLTSKILLEKNTALVLILTGCSPLINNKDFHTRCRNKIIYALILNLTRRKSYILCPKLIGLLLNMSYTKL